MTRLNRHRSEFFALIQRLWHGLHRHPWQFLIRTFTAFSVQWTLIEGVTHFLAETKIEGAGALATVILLSIAFSLKQIWNPSIILFKVEGTDTTIEVLFGDLFEQKGLCAIGMTTYFESELGLPVSENSLHGQFLKNCFGGGIHDFDGQLSKQLVKKNPRIVGKKAVGKKHSYPIGTTALIRVSSDNYIVYALAEADPNTCKASSDVNKMWVAMRELWQRARIESGGDPLNIPLIGSGLSGIGLPARDLLALIIISAITETKAKKITQTIRIILHPGRFEEIDLRDVKKHWEES